MPKKKGKETKPAPEDLAGRERYVQEEDDARLPLLGRLLLCIA